MVTLLMLGPTTLIAQETEHPICRTTEGKLFATADQVRKCLVDERKAQRVDEAVAASSEATAAANTEAGKVVKLEELLNEERATSDARLVRNVELDHQVADLERRPKRWAAVVIGVAAFVAGGAAGYAIGSVLP